MLQTPIDAEAGAAANGGRRPTVVAAPASASPELSDRPRRRTFTAQDKLRILAETDRAVETGGIGAILRREGVLLLGPRPSGASCGEVGAFGALIPAKRGRKTVEANPLAAELALVQRDNARLTRRLDAPKPSSSCKKTSSDRRPACGGRTGRAMLFPEGSGRTVFGGPVPGKKRGP